ncbi:MAG: PRC-barrel domain-containing protein [Frankia sp.]
MTTLTELTGRTVVSRSSADPLGTLRTVVIDGPRHAIVALQIGKGRKSRFVELRDLRAVGPDAIVVDDESLVHPPAGPAQEATAKGRLDVLGATAFTSTGVALGPVTDLQLDLDQGLISSVITGESEIDGEAILGFGTFALVVDVLEA